MQVRQSGGILLTAVFVVQGFIYGILTLGYIARSDVSALISERTGSFEMDCLAHNFRVPCQSNVEEALHV
jgi:hypothetical protein